MRCSYFGMRPCPSVPSFSKNCDRLLERTMVPELVAEVVRLAEQRGLLSKDRFSVDGTLIQAWASHKSFRPKDDDPAASAAQPGAPATTE